MQPKIKPFVLIVLDGWGHREQTEYNAIFEAPTPVMDRLVAEYPHAVLDASALSVGLPEGQMGNSEIGHMTIGSGRVIDTDLVKISKAIKSGAFADNAEFGALFAHVKKNNSTLHVVGLLSPGGVHSHNEHLYAFLKAAKAADLSRVAIHAITDGRDVAPQSAAEYLSELEAVMAEAGIGFIATCAGRFYAMDRDKNWDRLKRAEDAMFRCEGNVCSKEKPSAAVARLHKDGVMDEHLEPLVFLDENGRGCPIVENDGVFIFNYRADRARMLSARLAEMASAKNLCLVTMTEYDKTINCRVAFPPNAIETTLAAEISKHGLKQAHIAETEKYAHATYFLNGGVETPHAGEEFVLVESRKDVPTHDLAPEMKAKEIADQAIEKINGGTDFLFINFANADMVGHTAVKEAMYVAVETVDRELGRVVDAVRAKGGAVFITADHGNAEHYFDADKKEKITSHTLNLVPAILTLPGVKLANGTLADVAPTCLKVMGLPIPPSMTGKDLMR
jgi:2,3-bisphosphoglycerate-independent phosphoglycerate mutase